MPSSASRKSSSSWNSWPTSASASAWFGETRNGSASTPSRSGSPSRVEHGRGRAGVASSRDRLGVEVVVDVARQRAGEHDELGVLRQVAQLLEQRVELLGGDRRPPLVDLGVRAAGRVDDRGRRARLALDVDEVVEDRLARQRLDDARAGRTADEPGRDDGHAERLQRARDVDALAAGERDAGARAVPLPPLEVRDGQRPVDRRVECDGDDHRFRRGAPGGGASCRRTSLAAPADPAC